MQNMHLCEIQTCDLGYARWQTPFEIIFQKTSSIHLQWSLFKSLVPASRRDCVHGAWRICVKDVRVSLGERGVSENPNFLPSSLPPCDVLSVKQTCWDSEDCLLFRLGRRQSSPRFASAATGESLQLTIIALSTDSPATHHSQSITAVTKETSFSNLGWRKWVGTGFPFISSTSCI